jgi:GT2 family glycosyltransferase
MPVPPSNSSLPLIYAVVPAFNRCEKTLNFLKSFAKVDYPNKRVVICDDGSTDNTYLNIKLNYPDVEVLRGDGNLWWSGGTNMAARHALAHGADYILTINDDCIMEPNFLTEMVKVAQQNPKYIVGCRIHCEDEPDKIWAIGSTFVFKGYETLGLRGWGKLWRDLEGTLPNPLPTPTMPGNGVLIPRKVFEDVGFYDEKWMPQYHADSDLVLRAARAGYEPVISLCSVLYNHINTVPLVTTKWGIVFSKKSDRYWKATWAILHRYGPFGKRMWLMFLQYAPFFTPQWMVRAYHKLRDLRSPTGSVSAGTSAKADPT